DHIEALRQTFVRDAGAQDLDVAGDEVERRADFVRELRRQLASGSQTFELSQLTLQLKEPPIRLLKLLLAPCDLCRRLTDALLQTPALKVELLGRLADAAQHAIELRSENADLIGRKR